MCVYDVRALTQVCQELKPYQQARHACARRGAPPRGGGCRGKRRQELSVHARWVRVARRAHPSDRDKSTSQLCRQLPDGREQCAEISLQSTLPARLVANAARELFNTMQACVSPASLTQSLGFFCILPHDPSKTFIRCERIPQQ